MDCYLKCQICGERLYFKQSCPCSLGEHLIKKHPELNMTHFSFDDGSSCDCCNCCKKASVQKQQGCPQSCVKNARNGGIYKTTVETWKPGPLCIVCPICCVKDRPCIRKERNKVAYTSFGAFCMLSCWPICFLPFLMPQASSIYLYCKHCGSYLGEYNRKTGTVLTASCATKNRRMSVPSNMC